MKAEAQTTGWAWLASGPALLWLWAPILAISMTHLLTPASVDWLHDVLRRLYYVPIIGAAFLFGLRGSVVAALASTLLYLPHAFLMAGMQDSMLHQDPTGTANKVLEVLLYNVVGLVTGLLAEREHRSRLEVERKIEQMLALEQQLVRSGRLQALGQLTAGLAHEIRNPLASLKTAVTIVSDEIPTTSPRRRFVEILGKELDRLDALLTRFLAFARPGQVNLVEVDLALVMERAKELVHAQAELRGVRLEAETNGPALVRGDLDQLTQVLLNVLLNAIQFSRPKSRVRVRREEQVLPHGHYQVISILDEGPGIAPDQLERIFDPFFTSRADGTGLGLSIASRLMDEHGGYIDVANRPEGGARIQLYLPGHKA
ncbi:MAG: ATP-binding protein [bacterium]|jgi:signal transduction histidine kinase|nr:ATP-binding protein [bacterium]